MMGTRVPAVLSVGEQSGVPHDPPGSTTPMDLDSVSVEHQQQSQSLQQSQPSARQSPSKRSAGEPSTSTSGTGSGIDSAKPSRRSHPKSRTGCRTCKSRKIKVSEYAADLYCGFLLIHQLSGQLCGSLPMFCFCSLHVCGVMSGGGRW